MFCCLVKNEGMKMDPVKLFFELDFPTFFKELTYQTKSMTNLPCEMEPLVVPLKPSQIMCCFNSLFIFYQKQKKISFFQTVPFSLPF